jgi:hypothetical protein
MGNQCPDYLSYMLRLWRVDVATPGRSERPVWRASLECAHTSEQKAFASLEALFGFLSAETGTRSDLCSQGGGYEEEANSDPD